MSYSQSDPQQSEWGFVVFIIVISAGAFGFLIFTQYGERP